MIKKTIDLGKKLSREQTKSITGGAIATKSLWRCGWTNGGTINLCNSANPYLTDCNPYPCKRIGYCWAQYDECTM